MRKCTGSISLKTVIDRTRPGPFDVLKAPESKDHSSRIFAQDIHACRDRRNRNEDHDRENRDDTQRGEEHHVARFRTRASAVDISSFRACLQRSPSAMVARDELLIGLRAPRAPLCLVRRPCPRQGNWRSQFPELRVPTVQLTRNTGSVNTRRTLVHKIGMPRRSQRNRQLIPSLADHDR